MALVYRNGRPYLYRSIRRDGRVTSRYVASGESAVLLAALEGIEADERDYDRWRSAAERRERAELDRGLDELTREAIAQARDALTAAGYHQHKRGEWRRRRARRTGQGDG